MAIFIPIDEEVRIKIIHNNFVLQRKVKKRTRLIAWQNEGYFSNLISLSKEYLRTAPHRAIKATERFERLIKVIKTAETKIIKSLNQTNEKN